MRDEEGALPPPGEAGEPPRVGEATARLEEEEEEEDSRPARCTSICADRQALGRLEYWGAVAGSLRAKKEAAALKVSALLLPLLLEVTAEALEEAEEARSGSGAAEGGRLVEVKTPASAHRASQASRSSSPP